MQIKHLDPAARKGWYAGPWNSDLDISIGYAHMGVDEPHLHTRVREIYMVAQGVSQLRVEHQTYLLAAGDMVVVEPGEAHTFLSSSSDYLHFVIHTPGLAGEAARQEKILITKDRLGL